MIKWVDIKDYEGLYQLSENGDIKNNSDRIISQQKTNSGYMVVHLWKNNKRKAFTIHRLVAIHFIPNPLNKLQVDHIDFNKSNNKVDNLQWVNANENMSKNWENGRMENAREKVRVRMSEIATRNKIENGERLRELNIKLRKPIARLDSNGKIIQTFHSAKEAERLGFINVRKVLQGKQLTCLGSKFIYI